MPQSCAKTKVKNCNTLLIYTAIGKIFVLAATTVQQNIYILSNIAMTKILPIAV